MATDPQKSEIHEATDDATSSPASDPDYRPGKSAAPGRQQHAWEDGPPPVPLDPPKDLHIISDDTDAGGPLVVESGDPGLNPPRTPKDPFPTERTPEIDPPVR